MRNYFRGTFNKKRYIENRDKYVPFYVLIGVIYPL